LTHVQHLKVYKNYFSEAVILNKSGSERTVVPLQGVEEWLRLFLTPTSDESEWAASGSCPFTRERTPDVTHWVGPSQLDDLEKE
jgi:hypothetical protein